MLWRARDVSSAPATITTAEHLFSAPSESPAEQSTNAKSKSEGKKLESDKECETNHTQLSLHRGTKTIGLVAATLVKNNVGFRFSHYKCKHQQRHMAFNADCDFLFLFHFLSLESSRRWGRGEIWNFGVAKQLANRSVLLPSKLSVNYFSFSYFRVSLNSPSVPFARVKSHVMLVMR
nr:hypothetical protein Itr_chr09CG07820 [Ipomoea trifida]